MTTHVVKQPCGACLTLFRSVLSFAACAAAAAATAAADASHQVTGRSFMPLAASKKPDGNKWRKEPILQTRGSKFIKFQEARIQVRGWVTLCSPVLLFFICSVASLAGQSTTSVFCRGLQSKAGWRVLGLGPCLTLCACPVELSTHSASVSPLSLSNSTPLRTTGDA
jgi:hypothetical protein